MPAHWASTDPFKQHSSDDKASSPSPPVPAERASKRGATKASPVAKATVPAPSKRGGAAIKASKAKEAQGAGDDEGDDDAGDDIPVDAGARDDDDDDDYAAEEEDDEEDEDEDFGEEEPDEDEDEGTSTKKRKSPAAKKAPAPKKAAITPKPRCDRRRKL